MTCIKKLSTQQFSVHIRNEGVGEKKHTSSHMALKIIKISECKLPTYSMKANCSAYYFYIFIFTPLFVNMGGGGGVFLLVFMGGTGYENGRRYSCTEKIQLY